VIYSLVLTCRACSADPCDWLNHVLAELPQRGANDGIDDLLPFNFVRKRDSAAENTG
jgi:transposase